MCKYVQTQKTLWVSVVMLSALLVACSGGSGGGNNANPPVAVSNSDRGGEIVAEYLKRDTSPYRHDKVRLTVKDEDGQTEVTEIEVWRKQAEGTTTTLSLITKPAEDAGTGSLTIEEKNKPTMVVAYSASRDEFKETDTGKMFFGGLTVQELLGEWGKYVYRHVADRDVQGKKLAELEGKLREGEKSVIASTKVLFDTENYVPVQMHLFDSTGKEIRSYSNGDPKTVSGHTFISRVEIDNPIYRSHTSIEILSREYPEKLDDALFTREKLRSAARK